MRGDASSEDLNRTFIQKTESPVAEAVMEWIEQQDPFDLAIDFHGKRTAAGFFAIKVGDDFGLARKVLSTVPLKLLFQSTNGEYPGHRADSEGKDPKRYSLDSPGLPQAQTKGLLKISLCSESVFLHSRVP